MKAEEFDQAFDRGEDVSSALDLAAAQRPGLEQRRVNVDFPVWMIESLDREARRLGVTRQSVIKVWIAEHLERRDSAAALRHVQPCSRLLVVGGLACAGRGREPLGERGYQAAQFVRSLDDERPVERGEHGRHPVEPLRPQVHAEPAPGLRIRVGRGLLDARDADRKPGPDLLGCRLDPQRHLIPVRSRS
jgi:hypothetical protein